MSAVAAYAPLAATFTDPQGDDGKVAFEVYDNTTNQLLGIFEGSTVVSGGISTYTPTVPADYDRTYQIQAHAIDAGDRWSPGHATSTATVTLPILTGLSPGDTVFHHEDLTLANIGAHGLTSVAFYADTTLVGTDTDGTDGWTLDWDTTDVADGDTTLTASAQVGSQAYTSDGVAVIVVNALATPDRLAADRSRVLAPQQPITLKPGGAAIIDVTLEDHMPQTTGDATWEEPIHLDERCPTASVIITHVDPDGTEANRLINASFLLTDPEPWDTEALDDTFGTSPGFTVVSNPIVDLAVQQDDKIVALLDDPGDDDVVVARLEENGLMDTSFGTGGYLRIAAPPGVAGQTPRNVAIRELGGGDAEIVVFLAVPDGDGSDDIRLVIIDETEHHTSDLLDTSSSVTPVDLLVDSDGHPVVSGFQRNPTEAVFVARWESTSTTPDSSFGGDGIITLAGGSNVLSVAGIIELDDHYLVAADLITSSVDHTTWAVNPATGALDTSYGFDGVQNLGYVCYCSARDIVAVPDGSGFLLKTESDFDGFLETGTTYRFTAGGVYDDYSIITDEERAGPVPRRILSVDSNGRVYSHGDRSAPTAEHFDEVKRFDSTGLDLAWGDDGYASTGDLQTHVSSGAMQTISGAERLVVGGSTSGASVVARYTEDGS